MAKDDDSDMPPLGEDTAEILDQVKKGKSRNFLLICKGVKVVYLLVRKKAIKKKDVSDAKGLGYKGEPSFGVITGKGMDLVFNLARADGYEAPPTKDKTLKDFLEEHADFKCKPTFQIVDTAPEVSFDDDQLQHPLIAKFLEVEKAAGKLQAAQPERTADIKIQIDELRDLLMDGAFDAAGPKLLELVRLLKEWSAAPQATAGAPLSSAAADFVAKLKVIKPELTRVIGEGGMRGDALKAKSSAMSTLAGAQQFPQALELLLEIERDLKAASNAPPTSSSADASGDFLARLKTLKPDIDLASAGSSPQAEKIRTQAGEMATFARAKDYANALAVLESIARLLPSATAGKKDDFQKIWPAAKQAWLEASDTVNDQISNLQKALRASDDDELLEIAEFGLNAVTGGFKVPLMAALQVVDTAGVDKRAQAINQAVSAISKFKQHLATDNRVAACDQNPFKVKVAVRETLVPALDQLAQILGKMSA